MQSTEILITEHKAIKVALEILEKMCQVLESTKELEKQDGLEILDFIKGFADACHHAKEEGVLFIELEKAGMTKENGPITIMLEEHNAGRQFVKNMNDSLTGENIDRTSFVQNARGYIHLLTTHIEKEDNILYPQADKLLADKDETIYKSFEKIEREKVGEGKHEEYHRLLEKLSSKYL